LPSSPSNTIKDEFRIRAANSTNDWLTAERSLYYGAGSNPIMDVFPKPVTSNVTIIPATVFDTDSMNCSAICTLGSAANLTANFTWFRNGSPVHGYDTAVNATNGTAAYTDKL